MQTTSPNQSAEINLRRITWQCRRGMSEVEWFLNAFLQQHYAKASSQQQSDFEFLLTQADTDLFGWLMGHAMPIDQRLRHAVEMIFASRKH